jgi:hypothetical protein
MSAEPARPGPDHAPQPGTVILFRSPASRPPRRTQRRESPHVPIPPGPGQELTPQQRMAAALEKRFADETGQSLTAEETAAAFLCTLRQVRTMLHGALAEGQLGEGEHRTLDAMVEGMMAAPELLA